MGKKGRLLRKAVEMGLIPARGGKLGEHSDVPIIRTKCPDINSITEIKVCRQLLSVIAFPKVPRHVVKDKLKSSMVMVIAKLMNAGETKESIISFYWEIKEFRELCGNLELNESDWRDLVNNG